MIGIWDLVVVGAGPAGSSAALAALALCPSARVLLLDRSDFPRDKACGDGIAPHVLDLLEEVGVGGLLEDRVAVEQLELVRGSDAVLRRMARPAWVVPRSVLDARLVDAAVRAGATLLRRRVRTVRRRADRVVLDDELEGRYVVAADGAHSVLRARLGPPSPGRTALALRGYSPTPPQRRGRQVIAFGSGRQPSYAWSFDRGDGLANVGYGELLRGRAPQRRDLLDRLERLLPGSTQHGHAWRGHHLPLSSWRWQQPDGRILFAGDAAHLVNPVTGEGIYYAVATGMLAGRTAVAIGADPADAGARHRAAVRALLGRHLRHTALASRLLDVPGVVTGGLRAAAADQGTFDDLVELGLGRGRLTPRVVAGIACGITGRGGG
ncbi:MAG: geranylgeranyl reductase family protein, partial [Actinomycetota bacterium]|nr:geranylgeranyl reductase family protein [Actinomycetota bacterium]